MAIAVESGRQAAPPRRSVSCGSASPHRHLHQSTTHGTFHRPLVTRWYAVWRCRWGQCAVVGIQTRGPACHQQAGAGSGSVTRRCVVVSVGGGAPMVSRPRYRPRLSPRAAGNVCRAASQTGRVMARQHSVRREVWQRTVEGTGWCSVGCVWGWVRWR